MTTDCDKKVAEAVAEALKEKKLQDELAEFQKQFPKKTVTDITAVRDWQVGDWLAIDGVVYEITGGKCTDEEYYYNPYNHYSSFYRSATLEQRYNKSTSHRVTYQTKLKTIPVKGQYAVEGWVDLAGKTYTVLRRTAPGVELDNS